MQKKFTDPLLKAKETLGRTESELSIDSEHEGSRGSGGRPFRHPDICALFKIEETLERVNSETSIDSICEAGSGCTRGSGGRPFRDPSYSDDEGSCSNGSSDENDLYDNMDVCSPCAPTKGLFFKGLNSEEVRQKCLENQEEQKQLVNVAKSAIVLW